jgi:hypothetical protein
MEKTPFCGSYLPDDVLFLLKPISIPYTELHEKERSIQRKEKHYSEMISKEYLPSTQYKAVFHNLFTLNKKKLARHILALANRLNEKSSLILVSLARAGTPVGVLLKRILRDLFKRNVSHYSISIIRDRGIDENALRYIVSQHARKTKDIVFIDGWTGKGVITRELQQGIMAFNQKESINITTALYVICDVGGYATVAATTEDYLIPSSLLNATISGLISRSILNDKYIGTHDFHGCRFYTEFHDEDLSLWYVDQLMAEIKTIETPYPYATSVVREQSMTFINSLMKKYQIHDINLIKPGIGEAIRVLLRRVPDRILVQDKNSPEIAPFLILAAEKKVPIEEMKNMPYQAVGIISDI